MTYSGEFRRQASWREYQERINIDSKQPKLEEQTVGGVGGGVLLNSLQARAQRLTGEHWEF